MSEHHSTGLKISVLSALPIFLLLALDLFSLYLQPQTKTIPHLAVALFAAQLLCIVVFNKGQICNGQRSRLVKTNLYFSLYWVIWFLLSLFSNYHFALTDMLCLMGIGLVIATSTQPKDEKSRRSMLWIASAVGILGLLSYLLIFTQLPLYSFMAYNIFAQMLVGVILAHLYLVISQSRLQSFIALLPMLMLLCLFLNALTTFVLLLSQQSAVVFVNELALILYFVLHLIIAMILAIHIFKKWKLETNALFILLLIAGSLPVWSLFSQHI